MTFGRRTAMMILACTVVAALAAVTREARAREEASRKTEVLAFDNRARDLAESISGLPMPEYVVDILLRLATDQRLVRRPTSRNLLNQAFNLADTLTSEVPYVESCGQRDTAAWAATLASPEGLDRLSVRLRVVSALLPIDPQVAREYLLRIGPPASVAKHASDPCLVYSATKLYSTLAQILRTLSPASLKENEDLHLLRRYVESADSSADLLEAIRLLRRREVRQQTSDALLGGVVNHISHLSEEESSFVYYGPQITRELLSLAAPSPVEPVKPEILESLRVYIVTHTEGKQCLRQPRVRELITTFNRVATPVSDSLRVSLDPQNQAGTRPTKTGSSDLWKEQRLAEIFRRRADLRYDANGKTRLVSDRKTTEWIFDLNAALQLLKDLRVTSDEPRYFVQICMTYIDFLDLAPTREVFRQVLQEYVSYLGTTTIQARAPTLWIWNFYQLLNLSRSLSKEDAATVERRRKRGIATPLVPGPFAEEIAEELKRSSSALIHGYLTLEELAPRSSTSWQG